MFNLLRRNNPKEIVECNYFYYFENGFKINMSIVDSVIRYFKDLDVRFDDVQLLDPKYEFKKVLPEELNDVVLSSALSLYFVKGESFDKFDFLVSIEASNPIEFSILYSNKVDFNIVAFSRFLHGVFPYVYGYSYKSILGKAPINYGIGNFSNTRAMIDIKKKSSIDFDKWFDNKHKVSFGYFRDIYSRNFVNNQHKISGALVKDFVNNHSGMGNIVEIADNMTLWSIPNKNLNKVRKVLYSFPEFSN